MDEIYLLMCENWGGQYYYTEVIEAHVDKEACEKQVKLMQGNTPTCDIRYWCESVEIVQ